MCTFLSSHFLLLSSSSSTPLPFFFSLSLSLSFSLTLSCATRMKFLPWGQKFLPLPPLVPLSVMPFLFFFHFCSSPLLYLLPLFSPPLSLSLSLLDLSSLFSIVCACAHEAGNFLPSLTLLYFSLSCTLMHMCVCTCKREDEILSSPPLPFDFSSFYFPPCFYSVMHEVLVHRIFCCLTLLHMSKWKKFLRPL